MDSPWKSSHTSSGNAVSCSEMFIVDSGTASRPVIVRRLGVMMTSESDKMLCRKDKTASPWATVPGPTHSAASACVLNHTVRPSSARWVNNRATRLAAHSTAGGVSIDASGMTSSGPAAMIILASDWTRTSWSKASLRRCLASLAGTTPILVLFFFVRFFFFAATARAVAVAVATGPSSGRRFFGCIMVRLCGGTGRRSILSPLYTSTVHFLVGVFLLSLRWLFSFTAHTHFTSRRVLRFPTPPSCRR